MITSLSNFKSFFLVGDIFKGMELYYYNELNWIGVIPLSMDTF